MYEYAHISGDAVLSVERLLQPLPLDHPKLLSGTMKPVVLQLHDPVTEVRDGNPPAFVVEETQVLRVYPTRPKNEDEIADMVAEKDAAIEREFVDRYCAPIAFTVGGVEYLFHADEQGRENIQGVLQAYREAADLMMDLPDPRPWTPKDTAAPIMMARAEIAMLGIMIAARKDTLYGIKKAKQAAVAALTDPADIHAYDVTDGWE